MWTQQDIERLKRDKQNTIAIGIDPDVDKSGVALKFKNEVVLKNLNFFDLMDFLKTTMQDNQKKKIIAYVECGYLNRGNWHKVLNGSAALNSKIGGYVQENHRVAKKIVEMCEYLGIECVKIKPKSKKLNAKEFKEITGITQRTNQEQRDAYMLIYRNF